MKSRTSQSAVERELRGSREITDYLLKLAREIVGTATIIAPKRTGHYVRGLSVVRRRARGDTSVYVAAKDFKSHWIEWGAGPSPVRNHRPFRARHVLEIATRMHVKKFRRAPKGTR